ncbi:unnamed protein product [Lymnaea stagnalis]|uniref:Uncharacterized protein n=1 Tax=Lymnaea stagnalis TaxID=6523 RepID=A0AAV2IP29_LYMST
MNWFPALIVLTMCWPYVENQSACDSPGWFGQGCRYKCHCEENNCDFDGRCTPNAKCSNGWFGESCQYRDLATIQNTRIRTDTHQETGWLVDRDDTTCNTNQNLQHISITWNETYKFTWLKINFDKNTTLLASLAATLTFQTSQSSSVPCTLKQQSLISQNSMIIKCRLTQEVNEVMIAGNILRSICSLYISGGRNVALKQPTNQSSTYTNYNSDKAVDGITNDSWLGNSCTHTDQRSGIPTWTLTFVNPMIVNTFLIYNRNEKCCVYRLQGFELKTFDGGDGPVHMFTDNEKSPRKIYNVPVPYDEVDKPIKSVVIRSNESSNILTLCEVEAYGECPDGKWGLECRDDCPMSCASLCNQDTGLCHFCYGYTNPPYCSTECSPGTYGMNCTHDCSNGCSKTHCNRFNGECESCEPGYQGKMCNTDCNPGTYGLNCARYCPETCSTSTCNHVNGQCYGCKPGYQGRMCEQDCPRDRHGENCTESCPTNCDATGCNAVTGECIVCKHGFFGNLCDQNCQKGHYGVNCSLQCFNNCTDEECPFTNTYCYQIFVEGVLKEKVKLYLMILIGLGAGLAVFGGVIIVLLIVIRRSKRASSQTKSQTGNVQDDTYQCLTTIAEDINEYQTPRMSDVYKNVSQKDDSVVHGDKLQGTARL